MCGQAFSQSQSQLKLQLRLQVQLQLQLQLQLPLHMAALAMGQTTNKKMPMQQKLVHTGQGGQRGDGRQPYAAACSPHDVQQCKAATLHTLDARPGGGGGAEVASFNCERKCAAILNLLRQNVVQLSVCSQHISQRDYKRQQQVGLVKLERGEGEG